MLHLLPPTKPLQLEVKPALQASLLVVLTGAFVSAS